MPWSTRKMGLPRRSAPMEKSVESAHADAAAAVEAAEAPATPVRSPRASSTSTKFSLAVAIVAVVGGVKPGSVEVGSAMAFDLTDYGDESVSIHAVYSHGMDANFGEGKKVLAEGSIQVVGGVPKLLVERISIGCPTDYRPPSQ